MNSAVDAPADRMGAAEKRLQRLAESVRGLGRTRERVTLDRWLLIGGGVLMPLGAVLILLGWYGAAHTGHLFEQIPYLISGGLLGLAFVVAGGFCYFGYWLTKLVYEGRQQHAELMEALTRMSSPEPPAAPQPSMNGSIDDGARLVATATGTMFHRADCRLVATKDGLRPVTAADAIENGLQPCRICSPVAVPP